MEQNKTLIGKNNILFLQNDASNELEVHCKNLIRVSDLSLQRYTFKNFMMFVYPNKSLIYKDFLPDQYVFKYRPAIEIYKNILGENVHDLYDILQYETDVYYKTDTHINLKGNYIVYKYFIETLNLKFGFNLKPKFINLEVKRCVLKTLSIGVGDLTWETNLGNQILTDIYDMYFFDNANAYFYSNYIIKDSGSIRFLDHHLIDCTQSLENNTADWNIINKYIIYIKNERKIPMKVLIFYDSFLLHALHLYTDLFDETYFVKSLYSNTLIDTIKPDYVFEFRVERFLF